MGRENVLRDQCSGEEQSLPHVCLEPTQRLLRCDLQPPLLPLNGLGSQPAETNICPVLLNLMALLRALPWHLKRNLTLLLKRSLTTPPVANIEAVHRHIPCLACVHTSRTKGLGLGSGLESQNWGLSSHRLGPLSGTGTFWDAQVRHKGFASVCLRCVRPCIPETGCYGSLHSPKQSICGWPVGNQWGHCSLDIHACGHVCVTRGVQSVSGDHGPISGFPSGSFPGPWGQQKFLLLGDSEEEEAGPSQILPWSFLSTL